MDRLQRLWIVSAVSAQTAILLGAATGCYCDTFDAGYAVGGTAVDAETGEPLVGVTVEIQLEGENGVFGSTATGITDQSGEIAHDPDAGGPLKSTFVVTDSMEVCYDFFDLALAFGGIVGSDLASELLQFEESEVPIPVRANLTLQLDDWTQQVTIDIDPETVQGTDVQRRLDLGTIPFAAEQ